MADGKWIDGLSSKMPVAKAARKVLPTRLAAVAHCLQLAKSSAADDIEHVHQLRVASRRAAAALKLFDDCLTAKHHRNLKKLLRNCRRSAGAARDWDVFSLHLQSSTVLQSVAARPFLDFLTGFVAARRMEAQQHLIEITTTETKRLDEEINELEGEAALDDANEKRMTLGELALHQVKEIGDQLASSSVSSASTYEDLHRLRILGKRLRYSMEIFADCFAPEFRGVLYESIVEMQDILGHITDAHIAAERIVEMREHMKAFQPKQWGRYRKIGEQFLQSQRRIFPRERKRFLAWWPRWKQLTKEYPVASLILE
jgi:CHAD domain-containing protein